MSKALALALGALLAAFASDSLAAERVAKAPVVKSIGSAEQTGARLYRPRPAHARQFAGRRPLGYDGGAPAQGRSLGQYSRARLI